MRQCQKPASAGDESIAFSFTINLVTCHRDPTARVQMAITSLHSAYTRAEKGSVK